MRWRTRCCDRPLEQDRAETLAFRGGDFWPAALLPVKDDSRFLPTAVNCPAHRNSTGIHGQSAVFGGICYQFVQNERKALSSIRLKKNRGAINDSSRSKRSEHTIHDVSHQCAASGTRYDQILRFGQCMQTRKELFASLRVVQTGRCNRLSDRQQIFCSMLEFTGKQVLALKQFACLVLPAARAQR